MSTNLSLFVLFSFRFYSHIQLVKKSLTYVEYNAFNNLYYRVGWVEIIFNEHVVMPMAGSLVVEDKWLQKESFRVNFISVYTGQNTCHLGTFSIDDFSEPSFKENSLIFFQAISAPF